MAVTKAVSPFRLSSLLRLQKDPTMAFNLFQNPNPQNPDTKKPFRYSLLSYDLIISKLGRAKMFDQMDQILHRMKQETRFTPPEVLFCNVISFYGRARLPQRALHMFDEIPSFRCLRTVRSYNSLLDTLLKCGEIEKMRELLVDFGKEVNADACTYNILIHTCCKNRSLDDAQNLFDEMLRKDILPTAVTFRTLIYGLCVNLRLNEAFKLKANMMRVYKVKPNASLYTSLIKGLCMIGQLSLAFNVKEEMVRSKLNLDSAVYTTLISGLFKAGRRDEVHGVLEEMSIYGCEPDTVTYNAMISGFCEEKDFEAAYRVLDEMKEKDCKPDIISFNVIIGALCKEGKWVEANDLFEDIPRRDCRPDVVTYRTMFCGFCDWNRFEEATSVLEEMVFKGYAPSSTSACKFVNGLFQEGNAELLLRTLNSLANANVIDIHMWSMLISTVCKEDKLSNAFELVDNLVMP